MCHAQARARTGSTPHLLRVWVVVQARHLLCVLLQLSDLHHVVRQRVPPPLLRGKPAAATACKHNMPRDAERAWQPAAAAAAMRRLPPPPPPSITIDPSALEPTPLHLQPLTSPALTAPPPAARCCMVAVVVAAAAPPTPAPAATVVVVIASTACMHASQRGAVVDAFGAWCRSPPAALTACCCPPASAACSRCRQRSVPLMHTEAEALRAGHMTAALHRTRRPHTPAHTHPSAHTPW
jgi:hypothetical protein